MRLLNSLVQLIIESEVDNIYNKYYSDIPRNVFNRIVKADPKTKFLNDEIIVMGKSAKVLLNIYKIGNMPNLENLVDATRYLKIIYDKKLSVDLTKIKQISDLYPIVKDYIVSINTPIREILKELPKDSYKFLHNGEKWLVFSPLTEKAAAWLGVGTSWCTAWGKYSLDPAYKTRGNLFASYNHAPLYIMIEKSNEKNKYQFQFRKNEFRNAIDAMIGVKSFLNEHQELREFYFPLLLNKEGIFTEQEQFDRLDTLPDMFARKIQSLKLERLIESGITNPVALAFAKEYSYDQLTEDDEDEGIVPIITDRDLDEITYDGPNIDFELRGVSPNNLIYTRDLLSRIQYLEGEKSDSSLYDNIYNDEEGFKEMLPEMIDSYFEEKGQGIDYKKYKFPTLDRFRDFFKQKMGTKKSKYYDAIFSEFRDKVYDLTSPSYSGAIEHDLDEIRKYGFVTESGYYTTNYSQTRTLTVNSYEFVQYLEKIDKSQINDISKLFDDYVYENDMAQDDWYIEYNTEYPSHQDMFESIEKVWNEFVEELFGDSEEVDSEISDITTELSNLISKYYKPNDEYGYEFRDFDYMFDGSLVTIYLDSDINPSDYTVKILLIDKKTQKKYNGNMPVRDLYTNMFNYKLDLFMDKVDLE
jgi:hypothetical protein